MPAKAGLTPERVVTAALAVVDESGADALTLARVAGRTGVATPSLYKHIPGGLPELRRRIRLRVLAEFDQALRDATVGRAGPDALTVMAAAYRSYLRDHPHRHGFLEAAPEDPETTVAADRVVAVVAAVVRGYGLTGSAAIHAIRCFRAAVHGFTRLEALGGFGLPESVDQTFDHLLDLLAQGLPQLAGAGAGAGTGTGAGAGAGGGPEPVRRSAEPRRSGTRTHR